MLQDRPPSPEQVLDVQELFSDAQPFICELNTFLNTSIFNPTLTRIEYTFQTELKHEVIHTMDRYYRRFGWGSLTYEYVLSEDVTCTIVRLNFFYETRQATPGIVSIVRSTRTKSKLSLLVALVWPIVLLFLYIIGGDKL